MLELLLPREDSSIWDEIVDTECLLRAALADVVNSDYPQNSRLVASAANRLQLLQDKMRCKNILEVALRKCTLERLRGAIIRVKELKSKHGEQAFKCLSKQIFEAETMLLFYNMSADISKGGRRLES